MVIESRPDGKRTLGVLLIGGARSHQELYAPLFAKDPRCKLVGLSDEAEIPAERARWNQDFARALGIPHLADLDAALARADVDVVCVCAEKERRGRIGARCARAGKHVYMDKPVAGSVAQARELERAVKASGVRSQMFSLQRASWAQRARDVVRSGSLGDLVAIHCDLLFAKGHAVPLPAVRRNEAYPPSRFTFVDSKRELYTTGVYSIGLIRWLSGRGIVKAHAMTANYFFAEHVMNGVEDFGAAVFGLEGGLVASITAGRIGWSAHPSGGPVRLTLIGSRASAIVDAHRPRLEIASSESPWTPPAPHPGDPMGCWRSTQEEAGLVEKRSWVSIEAAAGDDVAFFIDCIESGRDSDLDAGVAARIVEDLFACYRSAALGRPVDPRREL